MRPILPFCLLICLVSAEPLFGQILRDRMLTDVRLVRDSERGTFKVKAVVTVASADAGPANLSYVVRTTLGDANGPQVGSDETVVVSIVTHPSCTTAPIPCTGGSCPSIQVNGVTIQGTCEPYLIQRPGCTPINVCMCWYRGIATDAATEVELNPGDKVTVRIFKTTAALADMFCSPANDTLTVEVGSPADSAPFAAAWREPTPDGGQSDGATDTPGVWLDQQGLVRQGEGPYEYWGAAGSAATLAQSAGAPNVPVALFFGAPRTSAAVLPADDLSIDLDPLTLVPIYDGLFNLAPPVFAGPNGTVAFTYVLPSGITSRLISLQGISVDPTACCGFVVTSRNDVGVQNVAMLPAPDLPPFGLPQVLPLPGGTTAYPWPRDVIVPNSGTPATTTDGRHGTLHSLMGVGFDATSPDQNSVVVNGIAAKVFVVRPHEILFRLLPAHASGIGGSVDLFTPSGVFLSSANRMENCVFAVPRRSVTQIEETDVASPVLSGGLRGSSGLQAARGRCASADTWMLGGGAIPSGTVMTVMLAEVDPANGQIRARCQAPTICLSPTAQPTTQSPASPNPWNDVRLRLLPTIGSPAVASLDDEGPGSMVLGTMTVSGAVPVLEVGFNASAAGSVSPFNYLLIVSW